MQVLRGDTLDKTLLHVYIYIAHHSSPQIKHSHVVHSASKNFFASSSQPSGSGSGRSSRASCNAQTDQPKSQRNGFVSTVHLCKLIFLIIPYHSQLLLFHVFFIYRFVRCYYGHLRNCMELFSMLCHHHRGMAPSPSAPVLPPLGILALSAPWAPALCVTRATLCPVCRGFHGTCGHGCSTWN